LFFIDEKINFCRILNLAGNRLVSIERLAALKNLEEVNLKKNQIKSIATLETLINLKKIILCDNLLNSLEDLLPLSRVN
jgi:Leucine-rich repeat (LRR) protein